MKVKCYVCGPAKCKHGANAIARPTVGRTYYGSGMCGVSRCRALGPHDHEGFRMPPRLLTDAEARKVVPLKVGRV
jgi:hypothetical protein